jgi:hypothetical protein
MLLAAAASYAGLFVTLLWQALSGQSVIGGDVTTSAPLATWAALSLLAVALIGGGADGDPAADAFGNQFATRR